MVHGCYIAWIHNFDATSAVPFATKINNSDIVTTMPTNIKRNCVETFWKLCCKVAIRRHTTAYAICINVTYF